MVEDEPALREALREVLLEEGLLVDVAADGSQALAAVSRREPDVVLMDLRMSGTDGAEAMIQIKAHAPDAEIIVFSTYADRPPRGFWRNRGSSDTW